MYMYELFFILGLDFPMFSHSQVCTILCFNDPGKRPENIVGKGENAGNQHFLLYPQCFHFC